MKLLICLLFTATSCGGSSNTSHSEDAGKTISCSEACDVVNLSNNDLKARFGSTQIPNQYQFATPHAEGAGFKAYSKCLKEPGNSIHTKSCTTRALAACTQACTASGR